MSAAADNTHAELTQAIVAGMEFDGTRKALASDNPDLIVQAQHSGLLLGIIQLQRAGISKAAQDAHGMAWLHFASIAVLLAILWRVW